LLKIGAGAAQNVTVDLLGFFLRLDAQFAFEPAHALLILLERRRALPLRQQQPHQGALHSLLRWIDGEHATRGLNGRFRRFGRLPVDQRRQRLDRKSVQPVALKASPFIEFGLVQIKAGQKLALA
jgi:hypothetical protein